MMIQKLLLIFVIFNAANGCHHKPHGSGYKPSEDAFKPPVFPEDETIRIPKITNQGDVIKTPENLDFKKRIFFPGEYIKPPNITEYICGNPYSNTLYSASVVNASFPYYDVPGQSFYIYYLNETVENLEANGYNVTILDMKFDAITNITYTNGVESGAMAYLDIGAAASAAGGKPSERERAPYMAQLGEKNGDDITFLCDGVVINRKWVLSAAHCFVSPFYSLDILRLGDYDLSEPPETDLTNYFGEFVIDYPINNVVLHPEYNLNYRYHDLALIELPKKIPHYSPPMITPICLPWDYINEDLVNKEVVLTGWGATQFGGSKAPLLQQVHLKVFDASICHKSYSELPKFERKHPEGLTNENIMCVGWEEDGRDACNGDSGAPITFMSKEYFSKFTLAGIVSGGHGCGLKEFPGLYIPVNKPKYLRWIKEVAFKDYD